MGSDWQDCTLGDVLELQRGFDLPVQDRTPGNVPVVASTGIIGTHNLAQVRAPGVVIGRSGSIGGGQYLRHDFWPLNTTLWVKDFKGNSPRYCYYLLRSIDFTKFNAGSGVPTLNRNHIQPLPVRLAPISEQRAIEALLGGLDDRVDLLRQTNSTLEAIAQALFKSWFIDFDPVRAKAEGREPDAMDAATVALFPAEFEESLLGPIPAGWHAGDVYEIAEVRYGAPFASKLFNTEGIGRPLVRIRDLKDEAPGVWTPEIHPKATLIQPGSIVVGMDGEFRAYLWGGEMAWMNQRICMFDPANGHSAAFVKLAIAGPLAHVEATETATTVIHLGKSDIDRFRVVVPPPAVARAFGALSQPLYERVVKNKQAMRTLAGIRDALLPRLIAGQLRLPEAQAQIEESLA